MRQSKSKAGKKQEFYHILNLAKDKDQKIDMLVDLLNKRFKKKVVYKGFEYGDRSQGIA